VLSVAFSPDGKLLASGGGGFDQSIILWDVEKQTAVGEPLTGHHKNVNEIAFHPGGKLLASGSEDGTIILWDIESRAIAGEPLTNGGSSVRSISFSPDGKLLASSSYDGTLVLWEIDPESWSEMACRIANRNLSQAEWQRYLGDIPYEATCRDLRSGK
jgi:WD40 repeat protein